MKKVLIAAMVLLLLTCGMAAAEEGVLLIGSNSAPIEEGGIYEAEAEGFLLVTMDVIPEDVVYRLTFSGMSLEGEPFSVTEALYAHPSASAAFLTIASEPGDYPLTVTMETGEQSQSWNIVVRVTQPSEFAGGIFDYGREENHSFVEYVSGTPWEGQQSVYPITPSQGAIMVGKIGYELRLMMELNEEINEIDLQVVDAAGQTVDQVVASGYPMGPGTYAFSVLVDERYRLGQTYRLVSGSEEYPFDISFVLADEAQLSGSQTAETTQNDVVLTADMGIDLDQLDADVVNDFMQRVVGLDPRGVSSAKIDENYLAIMQVNEGGAGIIKNMAFLHMNVILPEERLSLDEVEQEFGVHFNLALALSANWDKLTDGENPLDWEAIVGNSAQLATMDSGYSATRNNVNWFLPFVFMDGSSVLNETIYLYGVFTSDQLLNVQDTPDATGSVTVFLIADQEIVKQYLSMIRPALETMADDVTAQFMLDWLLQE